MKSLIKYHIITSAPLIILLGLYIYKIVTIKIFVFIFLIYFFVFRPYVDLLRIKALGVYSNEKYWRFFWVTRIKYYSKLMFGS